MSGFKIRQSKCDYRFRFKTILFRKQGNYLYFFCNVPVAEFKVRKRLPVFSFWKELKRKQGAVTSRECISDLVSWANNRFQDHEMNLRIKNTT